VVAIGDTLTWDMHNVAPNAWYAITKTFHVLTGTWATDVITGHLWVERADPQLPDRVLRLNHLAPDIDVTPAALDATLRPPTEIATRVLTVRNVGTAGLTWNLAEDPAVGWLDETPAGDTMAPSGQKSVDVTFNGSGGLPTGTYTITLKIISNDPDEPLVSVPVTLVVIEERYVYLPLILRDD
jgi:hypothetical protein